mgnify:CR=1 FL=1
MSSDGARRSLDSSRRLGVGVRFGRNGRQFDKDVACLPVAVAGGPVKIGGFDFGAGKSVSRADMISQLLPAFRVGRLQGDLVQPLGGGDERMADGDHFVAGAHAAGEQREVQRRRAARDRARVRRAHGRGEFPFERGDLRTLRDPP